jgi:hypothetical protein
MCGRREGEVKDSPQAGSKKFEMCVCKGEIRGNVGIAQ